MTSISTKTRLTTHERYTRMFEHRDADRIPIIDGPWSSTIERWQREGLPKDTSFAEYFDLDNVSTIAADTSPRYEVRTTRWP